ncbi:MAG: helix-turn-helix domain-containing protein [Acidaminococcaceae bacterium]|nr:helix-turn-helix domain-containing protein [Acidaminococcaceae bacterium]
MKELGEKVGVAEGTISRWESGEIKNMRRDKIKALAKALQISPKLLMDWNEEDDLPPYDNIIPIRKRSFPVIGTIAAGTPIDAEQNIETYVPEDEDLDADYALRVKGDSMIGAGIDDGDIVFIREQPDVENGEMAAVYVDGGATLKRVYKDGKGVSLYSENPKYPPMYFTAENCEEFRVLGKAVKKLTDIK